MREQGERIAQLEAHKECFATTIKQLEADLIEVRKQQ